MNRPDPVFDPFSPDFLADPYPTYRHLRENDPVHRSLTGSWILTRHDDIKSVLSDNSCLSADTPRRVLERSQKFEARVGDLSALNRFLRGFFIFTDPPRHGVLTAPVKEALGGLSMTLVVPMITQIIDELLDQLVLRASADLVSDYAQPLAGRTVGRLFGLEDRDSAQCQSLFRRLAPVLDSMLRIERYQEINNVAADLLDLMEQALERADGRTALGRMRNAAQHTDAAADLPAVAVAVFFAAQETTVDGLSNAIWTVAQDPARWADIAGRPIEDKNWVQELLRFESPVQLTAREATQSLSLQGKLISPGERMILYLGAANRDPAVFPNPDQLDLSRSTRGHLAFGAGIHRCLGPHLASEEIHQSLPRLFAHFPDLKLMHSHPDLRPNITIRGLATCPATLSAGGLT
jgi:pimeloyl-[acyl-carrier protein] synthase